MNLPNKLTLSRIFLTLLFAALLFGQGAWTKGAALGVFVLAALTDYWDGAIARTRGEVTPFGRLMDPIADKFLTLSAFTAFACMGLLPVWMVVVIAFRDVWVTGHRVFVLSIQSRRTAASRSGKHKTVLQIFLILGILVFLTVKETAFWKVEWTARALAWIYYGGWCVVVTTVWSGLLFLARNSLSKVQAAKDQAL